MPPGGRRIMKDMKELMQNDNIITLQINNYDSYNSAYCAGFHGLSHHGVLVHGIYMGEYLWAFLSDIFAAKFVRHLIGLIPISFFRRSNMLNVD
jgi:hypothetical protein